MQVFKTETINIPTQYVDTNVLMLVTDEGDPPGTLYIHDGTGFVKLINQLQCVPIACSNETTPLLTNTNTTVFHFPYDFVISEIFAGLTTAQTSGNIFTIDVNVNGASILSTKITIDNTEDTSLTASTACVLSSTTLNKGDKISIDIDQVGDGTATGLKVYINGYKA